MTRRRLSSDDRAAILERQESRCLLCGKQITGAVSVEFDHALALGLGGADDPDNIVAVHAPCHRKKTTSDVGMMAKADRQGGKHGQRARRRMGRTRKIASRGFDQWR